MVSVPVLLPLLTLMERPAVSPEGLELWETSDQGCDIMLRHLEAARGMAHHAHRYTQHALRALEGTHIWSHADTLTHKHTRANRDRHKYKYIHTQLINTVR